ncbi:MAG: rhomboid family intramembrane serine protease [Polaribacter sp.]|nr:rhomboid family intramembrane serine protease [Polaribacter sp.]MDG1953775.1 rhomboid family intramembrane serine protease [Polaribacter sp.]MDG2073114.1 rhomboid family intramembrane serine protease [Polaribacter sp.]
MKTNTQLKFSTQVLLVPFLFIFLIWFVYWVEIQFSYNFTRAGILPRNLSGLKGVLFSPFIHSDTNHLFNNSIPLFVLLSFLIYFYRAVYIKVLFFGGLLSGLLTWVIAREAFHIGASGIVYLLFSFVFFSGIIKKQFQLVAVSLIVIFLYGSMVWYVFPIKEGISWEGHLSGFVVGVIFAYIFKQKGIVKEEYEFKQTDFDLLFDDHGNFNPPKEESQEIEEEET